VLIDYLSIGFFLVEFPPVWFVAFFVDIEVVVSSDDALLFTNMKEDRVMNNRIGFLTPVAFVLLVALPACVDEAVSPVVSEKTGAGAMTMAKNTNEIPHKGEIFFYPTAVDPTGDPLVVRITFAGEGKASQFGRFTESGEYLVHSDANGTPLFVSDVVTTRYTASGDQVFLTNVTGVISLTGDPEHPMTLEGDFNYGGGTGRFEGITGTLHWLAIGNADGTALSHFEGTISTVGSGK
jgi:hypothetical protein